MRLVGPRPSGALLCLLATRAPRSPGPIGLSGPIEGAEIVRTPPSAPTHTAADTAAALGIDDAASVVKSLVFVDARGHPMLVLARGCDRIDTDALARHAGCRVRLATPDEALALTGHRIGCIPPVSPSMCETMTVLIDARVMARQPAPVFAGAGEPNAHLRLTPTALRDAACAEVVAVAIDARPRVTAPAANGAAGGAESQAAPRTAAPARAEPSEPEPTGDPIPLTGDPVELSRAKVMSVRRMARRLVFATVRCEATWRPPTATTATWQEGASTWQLIIGATLVRRMGGGAAEAAMRRVKPGCVLRVAGRAQVNQNPKRQRTPDLVVSSLDIVATAERARQREKARAEAARAAAAAAGRKAVEDAEASAASAATAVTPVGGQSRLISRPFGMPNPILVDSEETVNHFVGVVDRLCSAERDKNNNGGASQRYVGVDLEWRPTGLYPLTDAELAAGGGPRPAALLQIAPADGPPLVLDLFAMRQEGYGHP